MATKIVKKILICLLIVLVLIGGVLYYGLNQPKWITATTLYFLKKNSSQVSVKELTIDGLKWFSWKDVQFQNVRIRSKINNDFYFFSIGKLDFEGLLNLFTNKPVKIHLDHAALVSDKINASDIQSELQVSLKDFKFHDLSGRIRISSLQADLYEFSLVEANIEADLDGWKILKFMGDFYKGKAQGDFLIKYSPRLVHQFDAQLEKVDLAQLSQANPDAFANMKGLIDGQFHLVLSPESIDDLKIDIKVPGGSIPSNILSVLAEVIPKGNIIRQPLDRAILSQSSIPFEKGSLFIETSGKEKYSAKVNILSSKAFIDLRYSYDINVPGNAIDLMKLLNLLSPQ